MNPVAYLFFLYCTLLHDAREGYQENPDFRREFFLAAPLGPVRGRLVHDFNIHFEARYSTMEVAPAATGAEHSKDGGNGPNFLRDFLRAFSA